MTKWWFLILGLALGAALALWLVCPRLCEQGIRSRAGGFLDKLGLSPSNPIRSVVNAVV